MEEFYGNVLSRFRIHLDRSILTTDLHTSINTCFEPTCYQPDVPVKYEYCYVVIKRVSCQLNGVKQYNCRPGNTT